jgi:hypothetical protein
VILTIKTPDSVNYTAEWSTINRLRHDGITNATLKVGDRSVISGSPKRNPAHHTLSLLKEVRHPTDGWLWSSSQSASTPAQR